MPTRVVLLAVGEDPAIYRQAHGACLSLLAHPPKSAFEVWVWTSDPARFAWLGSAVQARECPAARLAEWRGPHDFFYRAKFCALQASSAGAGHLLFLDADVLVRKPLDRIVEALDRGAVVMHKEEQPLAARAATHKAFRPLYGASLEGARIGPATQVFNSGVIGIPAGRHQLIDAGLRLNDAILDRGVRYFLVEQVAWSIVLAGTGALEEARAEVDHYWGNKRGYLRIVDQCLAEAAMRGSPPAEAARDLAGRAIDVPPRVWDRWWHAPLKRLLRIPPV